MKGWLPNLGWVLLGLLIIAGVLISAGHDETRTSPKISSYYPSGTAALAELLSRNGYPVSADRGIAPKLRSGEVAIAFEESNNNFDGLSDRDEEKSAKVKENLTNSAKNGTVVVWLPINTDFVSASGSVQTPLTWNRPDRKPRQLSGSPGLDQEPDEGAPLLTGNENTFISAQKTGTGYEIHYGDGIGLTNRFIDKADNAKNFLEVVGAFARPGSRIVFTEGSFGDAQEPGLLETIGMWAEGAWLQVLFLLGVVVFTLNRRFGLPEEFRPKQRGGRELLDAITDTLTRARASRMALESAASVADTQLRNALKLPRDASEGERNRLLPENVRVALAEVNAASMMEKIPPREAFKLIQKLEAEIILLLGDRRKPISSRKARAVSKQSRAA